jgi:exopolyphosphatase/pppGpp-phosphohydrolase
VGVFDIGTRASRILVAPKLVPLGVVSRDIFFNDADLSQLGADVDKLNNVLPIRESHAIERVIAFMKPFRDTMLRLGIADENIHAVGTAVFRWLNKQCQEEVLAYIHDRTGVRIAVIPDQLEAQMSLAGISQSRRWRPGGPKIEKEDRILLLDQGGGSMEVSYISPLANTFKVHSFDRLGTIALRNRFFTTGADGSPVDPLTNRALIKLQTKRITEYVEETIKAWDAYPELQGRTLHAYALGSAITDCFAGSSFQVHNRLCSTSQMTQWIEETCSVFDTTRQQVMTVFKALEGLHGKGTKGWENAEAQLLRLYGLPVYIKVLERFGLSQLHVCGYGLRYGYYVWKYHFEPMFQDKAKPNVGEQQSRPATPLSGPTASLPPANQQKRVVNIFVSYARSDGDDVKSLLKELKELTKVSRKYVIRIHADHQELADDHGLLPGEPWRPNIQKMIADSDFGLLMVSPAFLGRDYIINHELPAFRDKKPMIPVVLKGFNLELTDLKGLEEDQLFYLHPSSAGAKLSYVKCKDRNERSDFVGALYDMIETRLNQLYAPKDATA